MPTEAHALLSVTIAVKSIHRNHSESSWSKCKDYSADCRYGYYFSVFLFRVASSRLAQIASKQGYIAAINLRSSTMCATFSDRTFRGAIFVIFSRLRPYYS